MFYVRATPVARERNPTTTRAGTVFQTCNAGRAGERDPTRHARGKRVFQTCNAGRAGARPYPLRAQERVSDVRHADTFPKRL